MEIKGEYKIAAPRDKVFAALNDPAILQACIPGCESLEKTSDTEMKAKVRLRIGPVSASFTGLPADLLGSRDGGYRRRHQAL